MKILILIAIAIIDSIVSFAQEPETIKMKEDTRNGKAIYYVLISDPKTYHGRYTIEAWTGNKKLIDGTYSYGKKQGLWTERYYDKERGPKSSGEYKDDIKIGKWVYYSFNGDTAQIFDYSITKLIYSKDCENMNANCPMLFVGGMDILISEMQDLVRDYVDELEPGPVGVIEINTDVSIAIDTTGKVTDITFSDKAHKAYEDKINTWIRGESNLWIPGKINGKLTETKITLPIRMKFNF